MAELQASVHMLAQQVQRLALLNAEQQRTIGVLRAALEEATTGKVVSFPGVAQ